ncbi:MAG TPA: nickel-dependent hydrogenase large subunit [Anaerolineaceae bacterium]
MTLPQKDKFIVPIGPQHPALKEPGHFEFSVDGETVTSASARLGYVHRGIEKGVEGRNWTQSMYTLERICGICSHSHATAFVLGVEQLARLEVPPRAQVIRSLVGELERIHSHLLWLGVAAHEGGFDTLFMYSWRDRETVMDLLEGLCGNRVNYSANIIGGVKIDVDSEQEKAIMKGIAFLEERTKYYMKVITTDETFLGRTRNVGIMTYEQAYSLGSVGPTARASGVAQDVRIDSPYAGYKYFPVNMILGSGGDLQARFVVRINDLFESYRLIREMVSNLPSGDIAVRAPRRIPAGETISRYEAPRGELFYFIKSNGGETPERVKVRTPSICNWSSVLVVAPGHKLADIPMLLSGIDPCFSCNDRMITIQKEGKTQTVSWNSIREYGIAYYRK